MRSELYNWKYNLLAKKIKPVLERKGFEVYIVNSKDELLSNLSSIIPNNSTVTTGGSLSVSESGVFEILKSGKYNFLDRSSVKTPDEKREIELAAFRSDYYVCSVNAITEDGKLVFLDGNGNRVAAVIYGPKNVLLISSLNKIVKNVEEARERLRYISPMNSKRLNLKTPCNINGFCQDCLSSDRICNYFVVVESSMRQLKRIKIILTTFEIGL